MRVSRRGLLIGTLAGGGLAVGYLLAPREHPLPLEPGKGETAYNAWIRIAGDGMVTVAVPQLEMGQGITTLIAQVVAHELGADWRQVAVEPAPASAHYANLPLAARWAELWMPAFAGLADDPGDLLVRRFAESTAFTATADGLSLAAYEAPSRMAAASVRSLLMQAAAERWGIGWQDCRVENGLVVHGKRRLSFGELAADAAAFDPVDPPPLRAASPRAAALRDPPRSNALPAFPRLDLPAKVDGSFTFAGDVRLPGMVFAAIRNAPIGESALADDAGAAAPSGQPVRLVRGPDWLAAVADTWWVAERALAELAPRFSARRRADTTRIDAALEQALLHGQTHRIHAAGDPDAVLARDFSLAVRYEVAPALHATLETASATARFADGRLELWLASQAPEAVRRAVADALGLTLRDVVLYPMAAGGSFDRRLEHDHAVQAAVIARAVGRPVQLTWSRWQEHLAGRPRTPVSAVLAARTSPAGDVVGWKARLALPATAREFGRRLFGGMPAQAAMHASAGEVDRLAMEGAVPPYAVPHMLVEHVPAAIGLPTGRLRGNAHGYTAFFNECFVDELARKAGREPLSFRIAMLGHDRRLVACLQRAAARANWGGGVDASGQGLACHVIAAGGSEARIAAIATARRDAGGVRIDRIHAAVDIGRIVNLDIARQQVEGGLVFGIGLALGCSTDYVDGLPETARLSGLGLPLLADCPAIDVDFINSEAPPADPGELGVAVAAPAIANALFSATGLRFRKLPLLSEDL